MMKQRVLSIFMTGCILLTACCVSGGKTTADEVIQGVSEVILYEDFGLTLKLTALESVDGGRKAYVAQMTNETDREYTVSLTDICWNEQYQISETEMFYLDPLGTGRSTLEEMAVSFYTEGADAIRSMTLNMVIRDENYEIVEETTIEAVFEEPLVHSIEYNRYKDAKADPQILLENEEVCLTLIEWGKNPENNQVAAVVCIENRSDETIPAMLTGMSINGTYFRASESVDFLEPGQRCYAASEILMSEIDNAGIESIHEVALMILTDESQNTGTVTYSGGEWYPVMLSEKGDSEAISGSGTLLEMIEDVKISYIEQSETTWTDGGYYEWKLFVENGHDEHIRVAMTDILVDGIMEEEWKLSHPDAEIYMADSDVGAGSSRNVSIHLSYEAPIPRPEISFKFHIRSMAGSSVIGAGKEQITLMPDQQ